MCICGGAINECIEKVFSVWGPLAIHQIAGGTASCHGFPVPLNLEIRNKYLRFS